MTTPTNLLDLIDHHLLQLHAAVDQLRDATPQEKPVPAIRISSVKIASHSLMDAICTQLSTEAFSTFGTTYSIKQFRDHCRPLLSLSTADMQEDVAGKPLWEGRFGLAHGKIARDRGYTNDGRGNWTPPCSTRQAVER
jgi:hypothetical protein